jgi:hypothetical protein
MKRIRFLMSIAGATFSYMPHEERELPNAEADNWLQSGVHAELLEDLGEDPVEPPPSESSPERTAEDETSASAEESVTPAGDEEPDVSGNDSPNDPSADVPVVPELPASANDKAAASAPKRGRGKKK